MNSRPNDHPRVSSALHPMGRVRQSPRVTLGQPAVIAAAFLVSVWITFVDIEDSRLRTGDYAAGSAQSTSAPQQSAGEFLLRLIGFGDRVGLLDGPAGRPRPASEDLPATPDTP